MNYKFKIRNGTKEISSMVQKITNKLYIINSIQAFNAKTFSRSSLFFTSFILSCIKSIKSMTQKPTNAFDKDLDSMVYEFDQYECTIFAKKGFFRLLVNVSSTNYPETTKSMGSLQNRYFCFNASIYPFMVNKALRKYDSSTKN